MTPHHSQPTILAVDDCAVTLRLLQRLLGNQYRVSTATNGQAALDAVYREVIDLLLLDIAMPGLDGLQLCRTLRNLPQFEQLPIVLLTARDRAYDKVQGRMAGATAYLTKPFELDELFQVVSDALHAPADLKFPKPHTIGESLNF
jgi:twitching motility two-component system response regulator PilG